MQVFVELGKFRGVGFLLCLLFLFAVFVLNGCKVCSQLFRSGSQKTLVVPCDGYPLVVLLLYGQLFTLLSCQGQGKEFVFQLLPCGQLCLGCLLRFLAGFLCGGLFLLGSGFAL